MSIDRSAHPETVLFLAWATRTGMQKRMTEPQRQDVSASECMLRSQLVSSQPFAFAEPIYGPAYEALFAYRLDQVDFQLIDWSLRGYSAIYLPQEEAQMAAMAVAAEGEQQEQDDATPETILLWQAIVGNAPLLALLKRTSSGEIHQVAEMLKEHFQVHIPLPVRTPSCPFLFQEFICMSLEQVNWDELAALILGAPEQLEEEAPVPASNACHATPLMAITQETLALLPPFVAAVVGDYATGDDQQRWQVRDVAFDPEILDALPVSKTSTCEIFSPHQWVWRGRKGTLSLSPLLGMPEAREGRQDGQEADTWIVERKNARHQHITVWHVRRQTLQDQATGPARVIRSERSTERICSNGKGETSYSAGCND